MAVYTPKQVKQLRRRGQAVSGRVLLEIRRRAPKTMDRKIKAYAEAAGLSLLQIKALFALADWAREDAKFALKKFRGASPI